jgi:GDP-mannose mannosyl hydrolase
MRYQWYVPPVMKYPRDLDEDELKSIVRLTPLVSIDLIIRDPERKVLVAMRNNEPAKGYYFVPGGRIRKDEPIGVAFNRILETEVGCQFKFEQARFLAAFEHIYPANRFGEPGYGTHYVVLAYEIQFTARPSIVLDTQHHDFAWMDEAELQASPRVHRYTRAYFSDYSSTAG